jgi:O-antigen ligase
VLAFPLLPAGFKARIFSPAQYKASDSISSRTVMLQVGWDLFQDHWFTGVGWGNFGHAFQQRSSWLADRFSQFESLGAAYDPNHLGAHNMYLELAVETGIVGLSIWLGLMVMVWKGCRDAERIYRHHGQSAPADLAAALQISLLGFLVVALFLHAQEQKILWIVMGLCVALATAARSQDAQMNEQFLECA